MVTVGIASIPSRSENLEKVLDSITGQADEIFLVLNYCDHEAPKYLSKYSNVWWIIADNSKGDAMKFCMARIPDQVYLTCDDDLLYPDGYIQSMVDATEEYKCIVTHHGKTYEGARPIQSYRRSFTVNVRCLNTCSGDRWLHVPGTGCMAFNTRDFHISIEDFEHKNMADVIVAREAHKQGVKIMGLKHAMGWLKYIPPKDKTIWQTSTDDTIQTRILNSFLK
jgi:glycosyltransferase involved in cell wall biosynthesis